MYKMPYFSSKYQFLKMPRILHMWEVLLIFNFYFRCDCPSVFFLPNRALFSHFVPQNNVKDSLSMGPIHPLRGFENWMKFNDDNQISGKQIFQNWINRDSIVDRVVTMNASTNISCPNFVSMDSWIFGKICDVTKKNLQSIQFKLTLSFNYFLLSISQPSSNYICRQESVVI